MEAGTRPTERVKVFCRLRPLLQREREGLSFDEFVQLQQQQASASASPESQEGDGGEREGPTFLTDKGTRAGGGGPCVRVQPDGKSVVVSSDNRKFAFDASLDELTDQESVYQRVAYDIVHDVLDGYNGTVLAYGQTSTGKTHTMVGRDDHAQGDGRGIIPRALEDIFNVSAFFIWSFIIL